MQRLHLFTDGSVNSQRNVGYGAYLLIDNLNLPFDSLKEAIIVRRFEQTSSTQLELQTLIWALQETIASASEKIIDLTVYTDSQNIIDLPDRRTRLEARNYLSNKNKRLNNYRLYQEFYLLTSSFEYELIKLKGHKPSSQKNKLDKLFSLVDRASRNALRQEF